MDNNIQGTKELVRGTALFGGKYVIEKKIGEGGFGITYKAFQQGLNRTVCIKEFFLSGYCVRNTANHSVQLQSIATADYQKHRQSFVKEAQTLASLRHQGVVEVIDIFDDNNTSYMVMPFIEGNTLQSIVDKNGPIPYPDAVNYITQVSKAVDYIHTQHILHRDIKPDNIMITADYKAILIDFGSARKFVEDKTQSHTAMLTHGYAPTEQYSRNSRKGAYTDIYAIGATLYFVLTGRVPVEAAARIEEYMPEPREINPNIPLSANNTIMKAMQLKSSDRYQNVNDFLHDLLNLGPTPKPSGDKPLGSANGNNNAKTLQDNPDKGQKKKSTLPLVLGIVGILIALAIVLIVLLVQKNDQVDTSQTEPQNQQLKVENMETPYGLWTGDISPDSVMNGKGQLEYKSDDRDGRKIYTGNMENGHRHGKGTLWYVSGRYFEGEFDNDNFKEGVYKVPSENMCFKGSFRNNIPFDGTWYNLKMDTVLYKVQNGEDKFDN